jgi:hypothetical protein
MYNKTQLIGNSLIPTISTDGKWMVTYDSKHILIFKLFNNFYELQQRLYVKNIKSLAISDTGDVLLAGASGEIVHVFIRNDNVWTRQAKLTAADGASNDYFGISVAISSDGNTAIIGASNDDSARGSAYIYTRAGSSWSQQTKLLAADGAS